MGKSVTFFLLRAAGSALIAFALFYTLAIVTLGAFPLILIAFPNYGIEVASEILLLLGTLIVFSIPGRGSIWIIPWRNKLLTLLASMVIVNAAFLGYGAWNKAQVNSEELQKLHIDIQKSYGGYLSGWQKVKGFDTPGEAMLAYLDTQAQGDFTLASQYTVSQSYDASATHEDWVVASLKETARAQAESYRAGRYTSDKIDDNSYRIIIEPHYLFVAVNNPATGKWNLWSR